MVSLNDTPFVPWREALLIIYLILYPRIKYRHHQRSYAFPSPKIAQAAVLPILQNNTTRRQLSNENWSSLFNSLLDHIIRLTSLIPLLLTTLLLTLILLLIQRLILLLRILLRCARISLLSRRIRGSIIPKT
jgi:hypothetical protein